MDEVLVEAIKQVPVVGVLIWLVVRMIKEMDMMTTKLTTVIDRNTESLVRTETIMENLKVNCPAINGYDLHQREPIKESKREKGVTKP